jgi:hypothetical protein
MQAEITTRAVKALEPGQFIADTAIEGFRARCLPSGVVTFGYQYRAAGRRRWLSLGTHGEVTVDEARRQAKIHTGRVAADKDPAAERDRGGDTSINALLDEYLRRDVQARGLRSAKEIARQFDVYVRPRIGSRSRYEVEREDMARLFDQIEDRNGRVMADYVMRTMRAAFNWLEPRDSKFRSPIVKKLRRSHAKLRQRKLDDREIRDLFRVLDDMVNVLPCHFRDLVLALLLTGQRIGNVSQMHSDQIDGNDWLIEVEERTKLSASVKTDDAKFLVPLSAPLRKLADAREGWIFSADVGGRVKPRDRGYSKEKKKIDAALAELRKREHREPMKGWTWHDLRRTARSILSGYTTSEIAERTIGHAIAGIENTYNCYHYADEKRAALEALARHVMKVPWGRRAAGSGQFPKRRRAA